MPMEFAKILLLLVRTPGGVVTVMVKKVAAKNLLQFTASGQLISNNLLIRKGISGSLSYGFTIGLS